MAIIPQPELFSWDQVEASSDMERLRWALESMPDETLMRTLEAARKGRRDDYPIRAVWNSIIAGIVFEHKGPESLRRELARNAELRQACGFDIFKGKDAVPLPSVYTRFLKKLFAHHEQIDAIFDALVDSLREQLPGFGTRLAIDSKAVNSHGRPTKAEEADGRRDLDADWGTKRYHGVHKDGTVWEKIQRWFGYKLHLIVDAAYELPVAYHVTKASASDCPELLPLVHTLDERHPGLLQQTQYLSADKGYDSRDNNEQLWDTYAVKPIIDIRSTWKDEPHLPRQLSGERVDTIFHTEGGQVCCRLRDESEKEENNYEPMVYEGFEAARGCLKYRCPAAAKGVPCTQRDLCNSGRHTEHGRIVRVPLDIDRRIFTPQARDSQTWKREYKHRSSVERVNGRLDVSFGFEQHYIRGLKKMKLRTGLALLVMLAMAKGALDNQQPQRLRSLVGHPRNPKKRRKPPPDENAA
jgi:hypothetical protein